ncbi:hypothetical protein MBANPS3_012029 [Mucor bainieri]
MSTLLLNTITPDVSVVHDLELNYETKIFATALDSLQMTVNMKKDEVFYSAYINNWKLMEILYQLPKGAMVSLAGPSMVLQKKNANNYIKLTTRIDPKEVGVDGIVYEVDPECHNDGTARLILLRHLYIDHKNQNKIGTTLTAEEILNEMRGLLAGDEEDGGTQLDTRQLRQEKEAAEAALAATTSHK